MPASLFFGIIVIGGLLSFNLERIPAGVIGVVAVIVGVLLLAGGASVIADFCHFHSTILLF